MRPLEADFVRSLTKLAALPASQTGPVGLAVSGGSDSLGLLHLAAATRAEHGRTLLVLTVDHGLREESADEADYVASIARGLDLPHQILRWDEPISRPSSARAARYRLLSQALTADGGTLLLTAHTADDQAETCFMRQRAGSGPYGLAGIQPLAVSPIFAGWGGAVIGRPFLNTSRAALRGYLLEDGIRWIEDPSNSDRRYERVRVRHMLEAAPEQAAQLLADAAYFNDVRRPHDQAVAAWLRTEVTETGEGFAFQAWPSDFEATLRGLAWLIQLLTRQSRYFRREALEALVKRLQSPDQFAGATLGHVQFRAEGGQIRLTREKGAPPSPARLNQRRQFLSEVLEACAVTVL